MRRTLFVCLLLTLPAVPDELVLESGGRISCEIIEETDERVTVRLPHGTMTIPRSRIRAVVREPRGAYLKREAERSLKAGLNATAVELFEQALRENGEDADTRRRLTAALHAHALALTAEYRLGDALLRLARIEELEPGHAGAAALRRRIREEESVGERMYKQAVGALEGGNFAHGLRLLDSWRLRRPVGDPKARAEMAAAHIGAGTQAFDRGLLRQSLDHFRAAASFGAKAQVDSALRGLRPVAVLESLREGNTDQARRLIDTMSTTYPDAAVPVFLQAVRHHVLGEVAEAIKGYADAARIAERDGPKKKCLDYGIVRQYATATLRAAIARPPQEGLARWRELFLAPLRRDDGATHFTVYAPTEKQAREIGAAADAIYERVANELLGGIPATVKAEIVVHATQQAYQAADPIPPSSPWAKVAISREKTGGICYDTLDEKRRSIVRIETFAGGAQLLDNTLPHEIVHVVQRRGLGAFRRGHWLDEGLATLFESEASVKNRIADLRRSEVIPLPEFLTLRSTPPERLSLFYNQACALAFYLRNLGGVGDWSRFLRAYATSDFAAAIRTVYRIDSVEDLERKWIAHLRLR